MDDGFRKDENKSGVLDEFIVTARTDAIRKYIVRRYNMGIQSETGGVFIIRWSALVVVEPVVVGVVREDDRSGQFFVVALQP